MSHRWEQLAQENAEFYIWTDLAPGDDFFRSGERDAHRILRLLSSRMPGRMSALELGCGVGRITLPMSQTFGRVTAVEIAPTMPRKLADYAAARGRTNITGRLAPEAWESEGPFDLAYSRIVFQHIAEWPVIEEYFARVAKGLGKGGLFYVQFDTRRPGIAYHVRNALPDFILPRTYRRGVRRIRRRPQDVIALGSSHGLTLIEERGRDTLDDEFVFRKDTA
jgi:cyclopropane fatty-acyl-phospholipid synthase-like methyltransferase